MNKNVWDKYTEEKLKCMEEFCDGYKNFLSNNKTERECTSFAVSIAKKNGFIDLADAIKNNKKLIPGDKVYAVNMGKSVILAVIGKQDMSKGVNFVGSHLDSPRLDIKATPVYENNELCMMDTHYYGGIKTYQWTAIPLAIHGTVAKKDGKVINFVYGEEGACVGITDLLPHLDSNRNCANIKGEALNLLVGSKPDASVEKDKFKQNIFNILKQYDIEEEDLFSAELEVVPSGKARDFGLDKSMVIGYGQDDKVCAYASLMALMQITNPERTAICILVDKEEVGSMGATGMQSKFYENTLAEIMNLCGEYSELNLRRCLKNSCMLSSDVTAGFDPNYPTPMNENTEAHLGRGISFNKYTGSRGKYDANDANPEFIARLRKNLDEKEIYYQANEMGKVDAGGGGTIAYIMANYGMEVIDAGVPVLSMHAPWEITSKLDIYESYLCYLSFYQM